MITNLVPLIEGIGGVAGIIGTFIYTNTLKYSMWNKVAKLMMISGSIMFGTAFLYTLIVALW